MTDVASASSPSTRSTPSTTRCRGTARIPCSRRRAGGSDAVESVTTAMLTTREYPAAQAEEGNDGLWWRHVDQLTLPLPRQVRPGDVEGPGWPRAQGRRRRGDGRRGARDDRADERADLAAERLLLLPRHAHPPGGRGRRHP